MLYKFAVALVKFLFLFCFRTKVIGKVNVPKDGAMILAVNHKSYLDPVMAALHCPRRLTFMAKSELFKNPLFGWLIKRLGAFPVQRGKGDVGAIKSAFAILKEGHTMLIFPQGRREKQDERGKAHSGVAMIAQRMKCPVIPVWISGKYRWMNKITVSFGEPISLEEYYEKKLSNDELQAVADDILDKMYELKVEKV